MCGLAGCFTSTNTVLNKHRRLQRARIMEGLLIANQTRGTDSTGVAAIRTDGAYKIVKDAVEAEKFVDSKNARSTLRSDAPILIGHTRMSSMGWNDVTPENAHPFVEGSIIGAHNGIINNYTEIDKTVDVDSQAVLRLLDEHELAYDTAFSRVRGSCALTWWDARDPEGLFLVAHDNPLSLTIVPEIETVYWSSLGEHLEPVMRAAYGKKAFHMDLKRDVIYRFDASDPFAWQESPVEFMSYAVSKPYNMGIGMSDTDYFGYTREEAYRGYQGASTALSVVKNDDSDDDEGKAVVSPPVMIGEDDEERYDEYWSRLMDGDYPNRSDDENDDDSESCGVNRSSTHALTDAEFRRVEIDDVGADVDCEYCGNPLVDGKGTFDSGLEMVLCDPCLTWWDQYGSKTAEGKYPEATA